MIPNKKTTPRQAQNGISRRVMANGWPRMRQATGKILSNLVPGVGIEPTRPLRVPGF